PYKNATRTVCQTMLKMREGSEIMAFPTAPHPPAGAASRAGAPVAQHPMVNRQTNVWGDQSMRMRRVVRSVSTFLTQLGAALLKAVLMSMVLGLLLVTIMHHMGVPVPSAIELLRGVSRLAHVGS
ncbi:MAG TPA: hypothetical protein VFD75_09860, partial [Pyrinomonadaceae bacterium]|nr:hypothetical protein [Pyrinomonadaceae bacterium]